MHAQSAARRELKLQQQLTREILLELPAEQWQSLEMAYFNGLSQSEIAVELKLPLGTIKTRIRLGLQKLHSFFDDRTSESSIIGNSESCTILGANSAID